MIVEELIALLGFDLTGEEKLKRFTGGLANASAGLTQFAARAAIFASAAAVAVGSGLALLGKGAIDVGSSFEDLQAVLEVTEGSSEKAKEALSWVEQFAVKTPYDLKKVSDAFVALRAYGLQPQNGLLESIGNATSAMNKDLLQGVEAIADAVRGENERLKEFGIVGSKAGEKITYTWSENGKTLKKTVKNDAAEIQKALTDIFDSRFLGAMDKRSKTFSGIVSNIGDLWTNFQKRIAGAGWFDWVKEQFSFFLDTLNAMAKDGTLDLLAKGISDALVETGNALKALFRDVKPELLTKFVQASLRFLVGIVRVVKSLGSAISQIGAFVSSLLGLGATWKGVALVLGGIGLLVAPWFTTFAALALAVDDFIAYLNGENSLIGVALAKIGKTFEGAGKVIGDAWQGVVDAVSNSTIGSVIKGVYDQLASTDLGAVFGRMGDAANDLWQAVKNLGNVLTDMPGWFTGIFEAVNRFDDGKLGAIAEALGRLFASTLVSGAEALSGAVKMVANSLDTIANVLGKLAQGDFAGAFKAFADGVKAQADNVVITLERMIKAFAPSFSISELWAPIVNYFTTVESRLEAFAVFCENVAGRIRAALTNLFPAPPQWFQDIMGAHEARTQGIAAAIQADSAQPAAAAAPGPGWWDSIKSAVAAAIPSDLMAPIGNAGKVANKMQSVGGPQAAVDAAATVANDNRVSNVTTNVSAPVTINATTNATAASIGAAAGNGVKAAGDAAGRNLAVTGNPGGMAK